MKLEYIVKSVDSGKMVKDIVKTKLNVSSRLYKKIVNDIYLNEFKCYTSKKMYNR